MAEHFEVLAKDSESSARRGRLKTLHGEIETPIFMPVGTQGTVKGLTPVQLKEIEAQIILGNTYHLNLRPGSDLIRDSGGLHRFMGWDRPILTDSGGFQAFSLAKLSKITEEGVAFQSHLDGARWAAKCKEVAEGIGFLEKGHHLFAIAQGSTFEDLRRRSAEELGALDLPGYAVGGVSVGEPEPEMLHQVGATTPFLPEDKPRYTMGLGTPPQMLKMIALGVDMFDCVLPSRVARNGAFFTEEGMLNIRNSRFTTDQSPLIEGFDNYTCRNFSRAYLRHLTMAKEMLSCTLLTLHNLSFYLDLMKQAREHIESGDFMRWSRSWIERYEAGEAD